MKRTLLILSFLFFALWIAALFYPGRTMSIHIALMVALLFLIRSMMIIQTPVVKETQVTAAMNSSGINQDQENNTETGKTTIMQVRSELNKQDSEVLS